MNIKSLAAEMNQSEADVAAFVNCLRVWTDKGMTIEQAIARHMAQMTRFVNNAASLPAREICVAAFYG